MQHHKHFNDGLDTYQIMFLRSKEDNIDNVVFFTIRYYDYHFNKIKMWNDIILYSIAKHEWRKWASFSEACNLFKFVSKLEIQSEESITFKVVGISFHQIQLRSNNCDIMTETYSLDSWIFMSLCCSNRWLVW